MTLEAEYSKPSMPFAGATIRIPAGMVGLPEATEFELVSDQESLPLMWLRSLGTDRLSFPVVEPGGLVPGYEMVLHDADAEFLGVGIHDEPLILNVLTMKSVRPQKATVNLVAPVVINRHTLLGRQVVLANYERYSVEYPVIDEANAAKVN